MIAAADLAHFRTFGFVVLRGAFDPSRLSDEVDAALRDGCRASFTSTVASGRYVPMMCPRTPVSLTLLDRFWGLASELVAAPVLPVRAKGTRYTGGTGWHADSDRDLASIGFAAYLEPLDADSGALRVLPGSHLAGFGEALRGYAMPPDVDAAPGFAVVTSPGDVIVFEEHLYHASAGGESRRQWRVDYVVDPLGGREETLVRAYFAGVYEPGWDGGYDTSLFPTYGPSWMASGRPYLGRLSALGAHAAAAAQEAAFANR